MGFFSKKSSSNSSSSTTLSSKSKQLIPCEKLILSPPSDYEKTNCLVKLTQQQFDKYNTLLEYFNNPDLKLPTNSVDCNNNDINIKNYAELVAWEKFWLTRECILRYLRASKWDVKNAIKNLINTIAWRREIGLTHDPSHKDNELTGDKIAIENETGKEVILGYDKLRRPLFYMKNGRQNTEPSMRQVNHMIYMMENAVTMCPQGVEKVTVLVDFKLYKEPGIISDKAPPISIARACLNVLQNHYPERLAKCILINMPWFIWAFLKMMYPFLDPATKEKAIFDEPFEKHIELNQLEALYNGNLDFKYKHETYWPDFVEQCDKIRQSQFARFVKFGGHIGLSEFDLKGTHEELQYPLDTDMTMI